MVMVTAKADGCGRQQPTGGLTAQVGWLGPKVGSRLALFFIHQMNQVNSHNDVCHDDSTINIVSCNALLLYYYSLLSFSSSQMASYEVNISHYQQRKVTSAYL